MSDAPEAEPDGNMLAIHEAGHLVVGVLVGRRPIKVSLDQVDGRRGCFWELETECGWDDFSEMRSLIAGPRAQVVLLPHSVAPEKLDLFQARIIQPSPSLWQLPKGVYDFTGWQHDVVPVHEYLAMPNAPADANLPLGTTRSQVVNRAEEVLLNFFVIKEVQRATERIAAILLHARSLDTTDADHIVRQEGDLWKSLSEGVLAWK